MSDNTHYSSQIIIGQGTNADIDTDEETVVEVTDINLLKNTQLTIYVDTTLGTHTSMEYRFYYAPQKSGTYYPIPKQNISTNAIEDYAAVVSGSFLDFVIEFGLGSCFAFKVTAKGVGGANGASTVKILGRDN